MGIDYVVCSICGFHAKSLGVHVLKEHGIPADEYKKDHQIICSKSHETYKSQNGLNGDWIVRAKENGEDLSEYLVKMGESVRQSILNNPEDRKRRAGVMAAVNKTDVMRKKASETAIKTSARRDIQLQRAEKLQNWRTANPEEFYEKCMSKMFGSYQSIPENELFNVVVNVEGYNFKSNQFLKSEMFTGKTHRKQIDIADHSKHMYLEFDGPLHFKETKKSDLKDIIKRDDCLDGYININDFTLIRVSPDQFSYRKSDFGFSTDCLVKINYILNNPTPGVHYIGEMYKDRCKKEEK